MKYEKEWSKAQRILRRRLDWKARSWKRKSWSFTENLKEWNSVNSTNRSLIHRWIWPWIQVKFFSHSLSLNEQGKATRSWKRSKPRSGTERPDHQLSFSFSWTIYKVYERYGIWERVLSTYYFSAGNGLEREIERLIAHLPSKRLSGCHRRWQPPFS